MLLCARAQLQIQIGHAMATSRLGMPWQREERSFFVDSRVVATGLNAKRKRAFHPQHLDYMLEGFSHRRRTAIVLGTYREALSKGNPWAQARCQMQITMPKLREELFFYIVEE